MSSQDSPQMLACKVAYSLNTQRLLTFHSSFLLLSFVTIIVLQTLILFLLAYVTITVFHYNACHFMAPATLFPFAHI